MGRLYFNLHDYQDEIEEYYKKLSDCPKDAAYDVLKELFIFVLKNYEDGIIGPKKLAYDIAGTMQFEVTRGGKLEELTELAGELELPDHQVSGNAQERFQQLISLIDNL